MPKPKTFHESLMAKNGLYAAWHKFPNAQLFNWVIFGLIISFMGLAMIANIKLTLNASMAQSGVELASPPVVLTLTSNRITQISATSLTLSFSTNLDSVAQVSYGVDGQDLSKSVADAKAAKVHTVSLLGLKPNTQYFYQVTVLGINNKGVANSATASFRTLAK